MSSLLLEAESRPATVSTPFPVGKTRRLTPNVRDFLWLSVPVAFGLWFLKAELQAVPYPNDSAMHLQMVRWASAMIEMGRSPLSGWYHYLQLGAAHFAHYQSLPHVLTAYLAQLIGPDAAFRWTLYLLLSFWPIAMYFAARLFGLERPAAVFAGMICPLVLSLSGLGYEWTSYVWGGPGVWSQLWAMMLAGPAVALSWRAVRGGGSIAPAAGLVALTLAMHFQTGYMVLVSLAVVVIVSPSQLWRRLARGAAVAAGSLAVAAWVVVPLIRDNHWINRTVADARVDHDSYGARKVVGWLVSGELFDGRRWPVLTLIGAVGIVVCIQRFRRDEGARLLLGLFAFMLLLYCGRPTLGPLLGLLPGSDDVFLTRFIAGVHLAGIPIIGIGGAALLRAARRLFRALSARERVLAAPLGAVAMLVVLIVPVGERTLWAMRDAEWLNLQVEAEAQEGRRVNRLVEMAKSRGGGRIYSGNRMSWGDDYEIGYVSGPDRLVDQDADSIGLVLRTGALSSDIETAFDERNPAHYDLLNIRYLIYPASRDPEVPASFVARSGRHVLWELETSGYLKVVDTAGRIKADNGSILSANRGFLASDLPGRGIHPIVEYPGVRAVEPTLADRTGVAGPPGGVLEQSDDGLRGVYEGTVRMNRKGVVLLKVSFDGGWTASVDGKSRPVFMVAPTFVGVEAGPGEHQVRFEYRPSVNYPLLFLIGLAAFLALVALDRRRRSIQSPFGGGIR